MKNFKKSTEKLFNKFKWNEYFLFMNCLRKELLYDILEYEDFMSNEIICNFKFMSFTLKEVKNNERKWQKDSKIILENEIKKNGEEKIIKIFNKKYNKLYNKKIRNLFDNLSIGDKIKFIKNLDVKKIEKALYMFSKNKDLYLTHIKNINFINDFYIPFLEYLRDIRNILSHKMISPNQDELFSNAFKATKRKHNHSFFIKVFSDQLKIIHKKSFYKRLKEKIESNPKINNEIFNEVMNQSIYKKI